MTKTEALYKFFNEFGIPAYPSNAVPDDTIFPWLTYEPVVSNFGDQDAPCTVNLWYYTESEREINKMAEDIAEEIGHGGCTVPYDGGIIWIKRGSPWSIPIAESDKTIKRRQINISLTFL